MKQVPDLSLQSIFRTRPEGPRRIGSVPIAEFDFIAGIYRKAGVSVARSTLMSFSRTTSALSYNAAGTLVSAAAHVPRFDYAPLTGTLRGILLETDTTNLLLRSQDMSLSPWVNHGNLLTITEDIGVAPDGTTSATRLVSTTGNGLHRVWQQIAPTLGTTYTFSVYLKAAGTRYVYVNCSAMLGAQLAVDLTTGAYASVGSGPFTVTALPNGWWRVAVTGVAASTANGPWLQANTSLAAADQSFAGDGVSGFLAWGAQLEARGSASSYVATAAVPATRAADVAGLLGISATCSVTLTYDDLSTETRLAQTVAPGWWPSLTLPRLCALVLN